MKITLDGMYLAQLSTLCHVVDGGQTSGKCMRAFNSGCLLDENHTVVNEANVSGGCGGGGTELS